MTRNTMGEDIKATVMDWNQRNGYQLSDDDVDELSEAVEGAAKDSVREWANG